MADQKGNRKENQKVKGAEARERLVCAEERAKEKAKGHLKGFMDFVREQGVVGLAVGLAIGTQAGILVKDIVASIVDPIIGLIIGNSEGLQAAVWNVSLAGREATFTIGQLAYSLIVFLSVCLVVYLVINGLKLDRLDKKKS